MSIAAKPIGVLALLGLTACASGPSSNSGGGAAESASPTPVVAASPAPAAAEPASAGLAFSAEQADRGRDAFRASCTECHYSSEFSDRSFKFKWRRRTAGDLFSLISTSMPEDAPGALELTQYADLVAYILRMNGFEAGDGELPPDETALKGISLAPFGN